MWARHSHTLAPLSIIAYNKVKFKWTKIEQDAFDEIKWIVAYDTLSTYLDFNEIFKIHTNASKFQLEEVISQRVKPIAFYIIKPDGAHKRYIVIER